MVSGVFVTLLTVVGLLLSGDVTLVVVDIGEVVDANTLCFTLLVLPGQLSIPEALQM